MTASLEMGAAPAGHFDRFKRILESFDASTQGNSSVYADAPRAVRLAGTDQSERSTEVISICAGLAGPVLRKSRGTDAMHRIAMSPRVRWHSSLSDESLRRIYRQSDLLLLTLTDCTANNALLEGMSCGLPVLETDVGGVRDYARDNFADFVRPREAAPIIEMLRGYLGQKNKLKLRGGAAREHVKNHLSWKKSPPITWPC